MSQYTGYAKQRGHDPIKVPDPVDKIQAQGLKAQKWEEASFAYLQKRNKEVATAFDTNFQLQEKLFAQNFKDQTDYNKIIADAKFRQLETAIRDENRRDKSNKTLKTLKALTTFSTQAGKLIENVQNERIANAGRMIDEIRLTHGVDHRIWNGIKNADESLFKSEKSLQELLNTLEADHVPLDVVHRIRSSSGLATTVMNRQSALRHIRGLDGHIAASMNVPYEIAGEMMTLNGVKHNPVKRQQLLDHILFEYLTNQEQPLNEEGNTNWLFDPKIMHASGGRAKAQEVLGNWEQRFSQLDIDAAIKLPDRHGNQFLNQFMGPNEHGVIRGPQGFWNLVELWAGDNPTKQTRAQALQRATSILESGIKDGTINPAFAVGFGGVEIGPGTGIDIVGLGKKRTVREHFGDITTKIDKALNDRLEHTENTVETGLAAKQLEGFVMLRQVNNYLAEPNPDKNVLKQMSTVASQNAIGLPENNAYSKVVTRIGDFHAKHNSTINDNFGVADLLRRARNGETITDKIIESYNLSEGANIQAKEVAAKFNRLIPQGNGTNDNGTKHRLNMVIQPLLNTAVEKVTTWGQSYTHGEALIMAQREAARYYLSYLQDPKREGLTPNHEEAFEYAKDRIVTDIESKKGLWKTNSGSNGIVEFTHFTAEKRKVIEVNRGQLAREIVGNPNIINTKSYLSDQSVVSFSSKINSGGSSTMLQGALTIQSVTNGKVSAVDVVNAQLEQIRQREIKKFGTTTVQLLPKQYVSDYKNEAKKISPLGQSLLESYNLCDINKACMKVNEEGKINQPLYVQPITEKRNHLISLAASLDQEPNAINDALLQDYDYILNNENMGDNPFRSPGFLSENALMLFTQKEFPEHFHKFWANRYKGIYQEKKINTMALISSSVRPGFHAPIPVKSTIIDELDNVEWTMLSKGVVHDTDEIQ